jgi:hypothetical protein
VDANYMGWKWTTRRVVAGLVSIMAAALLAGGTATAAPRATSEMSARQASHPVASSYFGESRTTAGFIPGL